MEAHAKKHPACLQRALGFLGFGGFAMESVTFPHQTSMDVLGSHAWVSCGGCLVDEPLPLRSDV
eukprot:5804382-Pyramimonas_sp.AAC.1